MHRQLKSILSKTMTYVYYTANGMVYSAIIYHLPIDTSIGLSLSFKYSAILQQRVLGVQYKWGVDCLCGTTERLNRGCHSVTILRTVYSQIYCTCANILSFCGLHTAKPNVNCWKPAKFYPHGTAKFMWCRDSEVLFIQLISIEKVCTMPDHQIT